MYCDCLPSRLQAHSSPAKCPIFDGLYLLNGDQQKCRGASCLFVYILRSFLWHLEPKQRFGEAHRSTQKVVRTRLRKLDLEKNRSAPHLLNVPSLMGYFF